MSYRAQLAGWRFVFLQDLVAPAEVPVEMTGFKTQQHRWARGSIQTGFKLLPKLLRARIPSRVKLEAFFHLTANLNHPLMLILSLIMVPALVVRNMISAPSVLLIDLPIFWAATLSIVNFYAVSQQVVRDDWVAQMRYIPAAMAIGIGLSVNNTLAVVGTWMGRKTTFRRTPKYGVIGQGDEWLTKGYRQVAVAQPIVEVCLGLYFTAGIVYAVSHGLLMTLPFLILFQSGFLYIGLKSLLQQLLKRNVSARVLISGE